MLKEALSTGSSAQAKAKAERRIGSAPIPDDVSLYLNDNQQEALQTMEYFGWQLVFIRRSDLSNIIPVIQNTQSKAFAVLDEEGDIIRDPDIGLRY